MQSSWYSTSACLQQQTAVLQVVDDWSGTSREPSSRSSQAAPPAVPSGPCDQEHGKKEIGGYPSTPSSDAGWYLITVPDGLHNAGKVPSLPDPLCIMTLSSAPVFRFACSALSSLS